MSCRKHTNVSSDTILRYDPLRWRYPVIPNSLLFCFVDLEYALEFTGICTGCKTEEIWLAQAENIVKLDKITAPNSDCESKIPKMWKGLISPDYDAPHGTYGATRIRIIKRIIT